MTCVLGIDPGVSGALATYDGEDLYVLDVPVSKSKGRGNEVNWALLVDEMDVLLPDFEHAFIEQVSARPMEGRGTVFKFGYAAGGLRALAAARRVPVTMVTPHSWKSKLRVTSDKDYSRTKACELFPRSASLFSRKKDNNRAEAALIAYYGRLVLTEQGRAP